MAYDFNSLTKQADEASNRDKFYTDFEDVDPDKLHQISELTDWMRTKAKGSDVREIIAQLFERTWLENIKEGNANMEVSLARGSYPNLKSRLDNVDKKQRKTTEQLAEKANKDEVTNVITPKGTLAYASLPASGNEVGGYYYCPDGDGTHGAGNYVWNGSSWFFGGTGDEGYNLLKKDLVDVVTEIWDTNIAYGRTWEQGSYVDDTFDSEKKNVTSRIRCLIELDSSFTKMSIKIESGFLYHYTLYDENKNKVAGSYDYSSNEIARKDIANAKYIRLLVMKPNNQVIKPYEAQNANIVISIDGDKRSIKEVSDGIKSINEYSALYNPEISNLGKIEKDITVSPVNLFDVSELVDGWRVNADGTESPNDDESVTGYIKCSYGDTIYTFRTYPNAETLAALTPVYVSEYNGNKEFIKRSGQYPTNGNKGQYNVSDKNTRYIRIEAPKDIFSSYRYSIIVNWDGTNKYTEYFTPYSAINTASNKPKTVKVMSYNLGKWSYGVGGGYEDTSTLFEKLKTTRRFFGKINADIVGMQEKRNGFDKDNTINANTEIIEHWYPYFATRDATTLKWDVPEIRSKYKIVDGGYGKLSTDRNYTYGYVELYGKRVFLLNVHLDPFSAEKRATERADILQILADKKWFIMTGDFNAIDGESEYADWVSQGYNIANGGFFGNYITTHGVEQMIDNIITSNNIRIDNVEVHSEAYDMCSSDHLPIVADLTLLF